MWLFVAYILSAMRLMTMLFILCMFITHQLVNAEWYLNTCKSDYCSGGKKDACTSFQSYFENCQTKGGPLIDWRAIKKECGMYILCIYYLDHAL